MQISDQTVNDLKKQLEGDRDRYTALLNQTLGALQVIEHFEQKQDKDALTVEEFEDMVDGKVEAIELVKQDG